MWIRSQDGESLRRYEGLVINFHNKKQILGEPNFYHPDGKIVEGYILGNYETEERAMEVLDVIQSTIMNFISEKYEAEIGEYEKRSVYINNVLKMPEK